MLTGCIEVARAIGGCWAREGEWLEVRKGGRSLSNDVVAQTKDSGQMAAVAISTGEGEGRKVVTLAGGLAMTVERGARFEVGHRSLEGIRRELMELD